MRLTEFDWVVGLFLINLGVVLGLQKMGQGLFSFNGVLVIGFVS